MKTTNRNTGVQLSLFDNDYRERTNRELIAELTDKPDQVAEEWEWNYSMERLYNRLTPKCRRIAAAAIELYKRREAGRNRSQRIHGSLDIANLMHPILSDLETEEFWLLPLTQCGGAMKPIRISSGAIDQTSADVRIIMRRLVEVSATQFAVIHNHPSGNNTPSRSDDRLTEAIKNAAGLFNIRLLDHIIIAHNTYYSYMDEGRL